MEDAFASVQNDGVDVLDRRMLIAYRFGSVGSILISHSLVASFVSRQNTVLGEL
jgi:hypothetical protein